MSDTKEIVRTASTFNCGGRCPLRLHIKAGKIIKVEGDDAQEPEQLRSCLRCRALRHLVYHPDRLKYPMKRAGAKGKSEFERITWDEALETVARQLKHVKQTYGNASIFFTGGGYNGVLHSGREAVGRLLAMFGGYTTRYGNISTEGCLWASQVSYGTTLVGNSREDLLNSRLIILWGWDPVRIIHGTDTIGNLIKAKEAGIRIICIDPRYHDTAALLADQWIPIRPGTDTAMMVSMAYTMIQEGLYDKEFLDRYTVGFDRFSDYVMGKEDGIKKTPAWAEKITGVPAETIVYLSREYATTKPAALMDCYGPARSAMGEQFNRCAITLTAMTGNIGRHGGSAAGGLMRIPMGNVRAAGTPGVKNPIEASAAAGNVVDLKARLAYSIHSNKIFDAFLKGKAGGYPADIKMAWFAGGNYLNQLGNTNKGVRALASLDFFVVSELFMTPTAKFADILLPVTLFPEHNDLTGPWTSGPYVTFSTKAIEPPGECKSDWEIAKELAAKLGFEDFDKISEEDWLKKSAINPEGKPIQDYAGFKRDGVARIKLAEPFVAFKKQIDNPEVNPFPTPSGKIEIYSQRVADLNNPLCPPIPKYFSLGEDLNHPLRQKYPLQFISPHAKNRVHSSLDNVDWLREIEPHRMWINPVDAKERRISDGDLVYVFNDRGKLSITARVTERIMPGVVCIFEGAWYDPDEEGIDRGGCANVLTDDGYTEGGACTLNTVVVQVSKEKDK
ncbi:MAG: molybdopterin-dependent oxidoreductase [Chloroflexota bacterium]